MAGLDVVSGLDGEVFGASGLAPSLFGGVEAAVSLFGRADTAGLSFEGSVFGAVGSGL